MTMVVGLDITTDLTVADLLDFADVVRMCGVRRDVRLEQITAPQDDSILERFEVPGLRLGSPEARWPVQLAEQQRQRFIEALDAVFESDGDARGVLPTLSELRDLLAIVRPFAG